MALLGLEQYCAAEWPSLAHVCFDDKNIEVNHVISKALETMSKIDQVLKGDSLVVVPFIYNKRGIFNMTYHLSATQVGGSLSTVGEGEILKTPWKQGAPAHKKESKAS